MGKFFYRITAHNDTLIVINAKKLNQLFSGNDVGSDEDISDIKSRNFYRSSLLFTVHQINIYPVILLPKLHSKLKIMENNQPTKIVSNCYKRFQALQTVEVLTPQYWKDRTELCNELEAITSVVGAIEVMSKNSIIKLCAMESSLRFMPPFHCICFLGQPFCLRKTL